MLRTYLSWLGVTVVLGTIVSWFFLEGDTLRFREDFAWSSVLPGYSILAIIVERLTGVFLRHETDSLDADVSRQDIARQRLRVLDRQMETRALGESSEVLESQLKARESAAAELVRTNSLVQNSKKTRSKKFMVVSLCVGIAIASFGFRVFDQACEFDSELKASQVLVVSDDPIPLPTKLSSPKHYVFVLLDIVLTGAFLSGGSTFIDTIVRAARPPS